MSSFWETSDDQEDSQDCRHLLSGEIFTLTLLTAELHNVKILKPTEKGLPDGTLKIKPKIGETTHLGTKPRKTISSGNSFVSTYISVTNGIFLLR